MNAISRVRMNPKRLFWYESQMLSFYLCAPSAATLALRASRDERRSGVVCISCTFDRAPASRSWVFSLAKMGQTLEKGMHFVHDSAFAAAGGGVDIRPPKPSGGHVATKRALLHQ